MNKEKAKSIVKENIETLKTILDTLIKPEFNELKDMLLGQLDTLNTNINTAIDNAKE